MHRAYLHGIHPRSRMQTSPHYQTQANKQATHPALYPRQPTIRHQDQDKKKTTNLAYH
jgi:hypothetical protein